MVVLGITGLSCSGKTFIAESLPDLVFASLISATTRPPRPNELPGFDYHFLDNEAFSGSDCLEDTEFAGFQYGLLQSEFDRVLASGLSPVHVCTPSGISSLQAYCATLGLPFVSVFVEVPIRTAFFRMLKRWMSDPKLSIPYLAERLAWLLDVESSWSGQFNFVVEQGSDRFMPLVSELTDIGKGKASPPPPLYRQPAFGIRDAAATISGLLRHIDRPRNPDDCESIAALLCDHLCPSFVELVPDSSL